MEPQKEYSAVPPKRTFNLSLDYRVIILILLVIIAGMLVIWKPWVKSPQLSDHIITVTGDATVKAEPDEFVFSPTYEFKNADKQTALNLLTQKSNEIVGKLKGLGVSDSQIKTNSNGNDNGGPYYYDYVLKPDNTSTYTLQLTVTLDSRSTSQKVQDYLTTTSPIGTVSPVANFSDSKRKSLENQARDQATNDARTKATQTAKNLGFKLGSIKSVNDDSGFGQPVPLGAATTNSLAAGSKVSQDLSVQPGQNSLDYTVSVVYYVR